MEFVKINGVNYSLNRGQLVTITELGKRAEKIEGWKKVKSKEISHGQRLDIYRKEAR